MVTMPNNMASVDEMPPLLDHKAGPPSLEHLVSAVQKCRNDKNLTHAKCVHKYIQNHQLETNATLGNYLVPMLVECGSVLDARELFDKLAERSEHAWTSLIEGYFHQGDLQHGFEFYQKMKDNCVYPSQFTFMALLKAVIHGKSIDLGQEVHLDIVKEEFESNLFVVNSLIDMYAKCGYLVEAQEVFDMLTNRDIVSWNTLIGGYAEHGLYYEALHCFDTMKLDHVAPNAVTFVCSLKACGTRETIDKGLEIHTYIVLQGFDDIHLVKNSLMNVYAKLGMVAEAQGVFDNLNMRDNVSWNTLITAYAEHGLFEEVLDCIKQMQKEHVPLDPVTCLCSLRACSSSMLSITTGFEMHAEVVKEGLEKELFVGNTLMDMYVKCGSFNDAKVIFDELPVRDVISWNIFFMSCIEDGLGHEALAGFRQMKAEGVPATASIYLSILKCLSSMRYLDKAKEIHSEIIKRGLETDPFLGNSVVNVYAKCQSLEEATAVFDQLQSCDVVMWNTIMAAFIEQGLGEEALGYFSQMQLLGILPDCLTFVCALRSCIILGDLITGQEVHTEIVKRGVKDMLTSTTLVDFYARIGCLVEAQDVFDHLQVKDVITWTALIAGYAEHGLENEVVDCLEQMQLEGVNPDAVTFVSSLKGCGSVGALERGRGIHAAVARAGFELIQRSTENVSSKGGPGIFQMTELNLINALIDMYAKCGSMIDAQKVFDLSPIVDVVAWNSLIAGYSRQEEVERVAGLVACMREKGVKPDEHTVRNVLSICSHAGLLEEGQKTFEALVKQLDHTFSIGSINCLIDLFGRAGRVDEAAAVLEKVPLQLDFVTWSTLLDGCRKKGNLRLSRTAFAQAVKLAREGTSAFVLMSDIYAGLSSMEGLEWD